MIVGRQSGFAGGTAELCEAWQECCIDGGRHTDFKEIRKYERLLFFRHANFCADRENRFIIAAVAEQQIQFYDHISGDTDILRTENRRSHALIITG